MSPSGDSGNALNVADEMRSQSFSTGSRRPPRLSIVFQDRGLPLYFVTFCTADRKYLLANSKVHEAFLRYGERGIREHGVAVGRYVIMPDHIHLFVRGGPEFVLQVWVRGLRRSLSDALRETGPAGSVWQEGFFDHVMRSSESYAEKWAYVRENPARKGLVEKADEWPYAGEIVAIERT